jgi:hypothetical protein
MVSVALMARASFAHSARVKLRDWRRGRMRARKSASLA